MNSRTYWRLREEKWIKESIKRDKDLAKEINRVMQDAYADIQKDIDSFYARYASKEGITIADARKAVAKHDVQKFASQAKKYVKAKDFSPRANEELRLYNLTMKINRLEMLKAEINLKLIGSVDEINNLLKNEAYQQAMLEMERNAGILGDSAKINVEQRAKQVLEGSFQLSDSDTLTVFSDNIWLYKTELVNDLEKLLVRSFTRGENPRVMARQLKKQFDVTGYQAERLARTEMARMQTAIQRDSLEENGIKQYEYIAEPSACRICGAIDGKIFDLKGLVVGENASPMHPNCRCRIAPYVSSNDMYRDWLDRGIITKSEYQSAVAFKRDYDTKFEKLMEKRNEYELSMQAKRKARRLK